MAGRHTADLAWFGVERSPVGELDPQPSRDLVPGVRRLAQLGAGDRPYMLRPSPAGREHHPPDVPGRRVDEFHSPLLESAHLVRPREVVVPGLWPARVPCLHFFLPDDAARVNVEDRRGEHPQAVRVFATLHEGDGAVSGHDVVDVVGDIPVEHVRQERSDLIPTVQDLRMAGRVPLIDDGNLGIVGVHAQHGVEVAVFHPLAQRIHVQRSAAGY
jgi:hypothetical protein